MLYFAYGSNLDRAQMRTRCPGATVEARATLPGYTLVFGGFSRRWGGGVASLQRVRGAHVEGLLYRLDTEDLQALDAYEGHPVTYRRTTRLMTDSTGKRHRAQVYLQPEDDFASWPPTAHYFHILWRAYGKLRFNRTTLEDALGGAA
ncbi:gamma-glutamylcyclotransferase [Corallococcus exiguus]|uniref:gamma-glutamylcyclotransferase family protein n=1 Tax=Myxococcaceae TaxID=31 RepID=UPI001560B058|nr:MULTISPECIES: gamma-glutamylcyclotransferase family protein [Myxococcaceae]MCP3167324.1 gamma-glutamylcyclotransferase [Myxococcus qinghaiensis]NRD68042.1 gamma-glutamylcyclotransferase [Corallococcus exiguus]